MVLIPNSALGILVGDDSSEFISLIPGQLAGFPQGVLVLGGNDTVQGAADNELINGNQGFDQIFGGGGNDNLFGGQEDDLLDGGVGDDILFGNLGADIITGGDGNDNLFGGKDNDNLSGDLGNDILSGDFGIDALTGGGGSDIFVLGIGGGGADVITDFQDGTDLIQLPAGFTFSNLRVTTSGNQTVIALATTGEELVRLNGIQSSVITSADFVGGSPGGSPTSDVEPGSNQRNARDLGVLNGSIEVTESVGKDDDDFYKFTLNSNGDLNIVLAALNDYSSIELIYDFNNNFQVDEGDGDILKSGGGNSNQNGNINTALEAGNYFIKVYSDYGDNTNYDLRLSFTPQPTTTPPNTGIEGLDAQINGGSQRTNVTYKDFVGQTDSYDVYNLSLSENSDVKIAVGSLSDQIELWLIQDINANGKIDKADGEILKEATGSSNNNGNIDTSLVPGSYFVYVFPQYDDRNTNYEMRVDLQPQ